MHKFYFKLFLVSLMASIISCSPKYTRSFQPTDYTPYAYLDKEVSKETNSSQENYWSDEELGLDQLNLQDPSDLTASNESSPEAELLPTDQKPSKTIASGKEDLKDQRSKEKQVLRQVKQQLKSMSKEERRELREETLAKMKLDDKTTDTDMNLALLVIITILLPPVGMLIYEGGVTNRFWISLLLTLLFYVPGLVYSLVIILGNR